MSMIQAADCGIGIEGKVRLSSVTAASRVCPQLCAGLQAVG